MNHLAPCGRLPGESLPYYFGREALILAGKTVCLGVAGIVTFKALTTLPIPSLMIITSLAAARIPQNVVDKYVSWQYTVLPCGALIFAAGCTLAVHKLLDGISLENFATTLIPLATLVALSTIGFFSAKLDRGNAKVVLEDSENVQNVLKTGRTLEEITFNSYRPMSDHALDALAQIKPQKLKFSVQKMDENDLWKLNKKLNKPNDKTLTFYYYKDQDTLEKVETIPETCTLTLDPLKAHLNLLDMQLKLLLEFHPKTSCACEVHGANEITESELHGLYARLPNAFLFHCPLSQELKDILNTVQDNHYYRPLNNSPQTNYPLYYVLEKDPSNIAIAGGTLSELSILLRLQALKRQNISAKTIQINNLRFLRHLCPVLQLKDDRIFALLKELSPSEILFVNCSISEIQLSFLNKNRKDPYAIYQTYNKQLILRRSAIDETTFECDVEDETSFTHGFLIASKQPIHNIGVRGLVFDSEDCKSRLIQLIDFAQPEAIYLKLDPPDNNIFEALKVRYPDKRILRP